MCRNRSLNESGYIPDIPDSLPLSKVLSDGDDGLQNDWRLREHWNPSPVWASLRGLAPPVRLSTITNVTGTQRIRSSS